MKDSEAIANMTDIPDEVSKRPNNQDQWFKQQREFIDEAKQLLTELLARTKKGQYLSSSFNCQERKQIINENEEMKINERGLLIILNKKRVR